jgi:carboxymethylenebutenolidase
MLLGSSQIHLADAVVGCHASLINKSHFEQIQVPTAFACAQEDDHFSEAFRAEGQQILERKSDVPSKFLVTDGTVHGFASRPDPDNPVIMKAYTQANDLIVEWAKTHL